MSRLLKFDEKTSTRLAGSKLNRAFLIFCFVFCFVFYGLGGTGGGFGAPGGGFSDSRSSGKPPLLPVLKTHTHRSTKTTTRTTQTNKNKSKKQNGN